MKFNLKYHDGFKSVAIPENVNVNVLQPRTIPILESVQEQLDIALNNPLGCNSLIELLRIKEQPSIAIAIPDETRPTPVKEILPTLLNHIFRALPEMNPGSISIVIGGGLHPPVDRETQERILPSNIAPGCNIVSHDAKNDRMVDFGTTSRGGTVKVNAIVGEADFKIVIGQIDPHQFVGFTGGSKGITVGCASQESIKHNHSLMFKDNSIVGRLGGNPVREDLNEAGRMIGIDFAINVVLNAEKQVVNLLTGNPEAVLRQGAKTCAALYGIKIESKFDIVVASCGGTPKDICLYQAQKGLNLASHALKKGGKILLLAACQQGVGDDNYFDYVVKFATPDDVLRDFKTLGFKMGAHKAYLFGTTLVDYDVAVFSDLNPAIMSQCHLRAADPSNIIKEWVGGFEGVPKVAVIPYANTTYFYGE